MWQDVLLVFSSVGIVENKDLHKLIVHYQQFLHGIAHRVETVHVRSPEIVSESERQTAGTVAQQMADGLFDIVVFAGTKPYREDGIRPDEINADGLIIKTYSGPMLMALIQGLANTHEVQLLDLTALTLA